MHEILFSFVKSLFIFCFPYFLFLIRKNSHDFWHNFYECSEGSIFDRTFLTCVILVFLYQVIFGDGFESVKQNREICSPSSPVFLPDTEMSCGPSEKQLLCKKVSKMFPLTSNI